MFVIFDYWLLLQFTVVFLRHVVELREEGRLPGWMEERGGGCSGGSALEGLYDEAGFRKTLGTSVSLYLLCLLIGFW